MASRIIGCGGYLPEKVVTNLDLEKTLETSDEWIRSRTGITRRHIAAEGENASDMALAASQEALSDAIQNGAIASKDELDLIIVCTNTPDNSFPSTANILQSKLKLGNIPSFDMQAICSGFLYGTQVADMMLRSGKYKTVLVVCAEKMSALLDWQDRKTCVLFGDGAGAVILRYDDSEYGIIDSDIFSQGNLYDILYTDGGVGSTQSAGVIHMKGAEVYKKAVERMSQSIEDILKKNKISTSDIDYLIPHQANIRIIDSIASRFDIDDNKVIKTVQKHANTSAASIPLALADLRKNNKIKEGNLLAFTSFGAGATWGAMLLRW